MPQKESQLSVTRYSQLTVTYYSQILENQEPLQRFYHKLLSEAENKDQVGMGSCHLSIWRDIAAFSSLTPERVLILA